MDSDIAAYGIQPVFQRLPSSLGNESYRGAANREKSVRMTGVRGFDMLSQARDRSMGPNEEKTIAHHLFRVAFCVLLPFSQAVVIRGLFWPSLDSVWMDLLAVIGLSLSCGMYFNARIFPWRFSVFGPLRKTPPPSGVAIETYYSLGTRFAKFSVPSVKWSFFPGGALVSTLVGRVWLPQEEIVAIEQKPRRLVLTHSCKEVRSPIIVFLRLTATDERLRAQVLHRLAPNRVLREMDEFPDDGAGRIYQEPFID